MKKATILYSETEEIFGWFPKGDSVHYKGTLNIYERKTKRITLELKISTHPFVFEFPDTKSFTADSVTGIYAKLTKWFSSYGFVFKH